MNYTGSVRKDGTKWYYVIELGKDLNGKRKQKKKRGFKTQKEAKASLNKALHELNTGTYIQPSNVLLGDFMKDWLQYKKSNVAESSFETYYYNLKNHINPGLGNIPLSKLKAQDVQKFYQQLLSEKRLNHNTVRKIHSMLGNALDRAVKYEMINKNVVKLVESPKETKSEMKVWDLDQVKTFLAYSVESHLYIVYFIAINTGMRQGEILGLSWDSVDLENNIISVRQTLSNYGKSIKATTKTSAGMRTITVPQELSNELKKHKLEQMKRRLMMGTLYQDMNLVNASELGTPINPSNLRRNFNIFIKKAGLPKIRFHDLRHTHATLLLKEEVNPKIVSERLGHADTRMTLDRYSHVLPNMQKETATKFGELLYGSKSLKNVDESKGIKESFFPYVTNM